MLRLSVLCLLLTINVVTETLPVTSTMVDEDIHINQIGYQPGQFKQVVVAGKISPRATFQLLDAQDQAVFTGTLVSSGYDPDSDETVTQGDFSAFDTPGLYRVQVSGRGMSYPFTIGGDVYQPVLKLATRWLYLQRSGAAKDDPITGLKHSADHTTPAILYDAAGPHPDQTFQVSGGWWDAGDYGRYVPPAATTLMSLFYAYHFNPDVFQDGSLNIPESSNGLPDLLDEARWELEWLLKMQRADGAVHHKVTTADYAEAGPPEEDTQPLYLYDVSTQATAQYAGAMAEASLVYRPIDPAFADQLLAAAKRAWTWLKAHPDKYPEGGFINPENHNGGPYSIEAGDETGQRLWAAGSLFHATGEVEYADAFAQLWPKRDPEPPVYGLSWADGYAFGMFAYLDSPGGDEILKEEIKQVVAEQSRNVLKVINSTGYRVALTGNSGVFGYTWGSNEYTLESGIYLLLANEWRPDQKLVDGAAAQLNWILGVNPLNKAYITGAGSNPVRTLHHQVSFLRDTPTPGAIGEGPNAMDTGGDEVLQAMFDDNVPFAKRYADHPDSWATNEPVIYGNAAFVAVAAWFTR